MKKNVFSIFFILLILFIFANIVVISVFFVHDRYLNPYFISLMVINFFVLIFIYLIITSSKKQINASIKNYRNVNSLIFERLLEFGEIGYVLFDKNGIIIWMNNFLTEKYGAEYLGKSLNILGIDLSSAGDERDIKNLKISNDYYEYVIINNMRTVMLKDITIINKLSSTYDGEMIGLGIINIDNYNKIINSASENNAYILNKNIVNYVLNWCWKNNVFVKKISMEQYFLILNKETINILDEDGLFDELVENIINNSKKVSANINFSAGIAYGINNPLVLYNEVLKTVEFCLERGGDQLIVKNVNDYNIKIYGGWEKGRGDNTRNKLKQFSNQLVNYIVNSDWVLITGHSFPDYDSLGASLGIYILCILLGKKAHIIINNSRFDATTKKNIKLLLGDKRYYSIFCEQKSIKLSKNKKNMMIIVDTSSPDRIESREFLEACEKVVVIDHHRVAKNSNFKRVIQYIDTFSSSTSEIVTEILTFHPNVKSIFHSTEYSQCFSVLLAGITIDTQDFKYKTTYKTFEIAARLKSWGAKSNEVDVLLQENYDTLKLVNSLTQNVSIYKNNICIAIGDSNIMYGKKILALSSQKLINLRNISIAISIGYTSKNIISASCRSIGNKLNLQTFAEQFLNGGGHFNSSAFEIHNSSLFQAKQYIIKKIKDFI